MKLSKAIKKGCSLHPQAKKAYYIKGTTCALGAAFFGLGKEFPDDGKYPSSISKTIYEQWPELSKRDIQLRSDTWDPMTQNMFDFYKESFLSTQIMVLNDVIGMSREDIATLLEEKGL